MRGIFRTKNHVHVAHGRERQHVCRQPSADSRVAGSPFGRFARGWIPNAIRPIRAWLDPQCHNATARPRTHSHEQNQTAQHSHSTRTCDVQGAEGATAVSGGAQQHREAPRRQLAGLQVEQREAGVVAAGGEREREGRRPIEGRAGEVEAHEGRVGPQRPAQSAVAVGRCPCKPHLPR